MAAVLRCLVTVPAAGALALELSSGEERNGMSQLRFLSVDPYPSLFILGSLGPDNMTIHVVDDVMS